MACWLQNSAVTRRTRRNEAFTVANFKEILPELSSPFMASLIASCADDLFSYYRAFDATLPDKRPLIEVFYGRPLFNVSLLCDMLRRWGLPTRLISNSIGGDVDRETGLNLLRLFWNIPKLLRLSGSQFRSVPRSRRTAQALVERAQLPGATFAACIDTLQWLFSALVCDMLALTGAMSGPLLLLRRAGVLDAHHAGQQTAATEMFIDLEPAAFGWGRDIRAIEQGLPMPSSVRAGHFSKHGHQGSMKALLTAFSAPTIPRFATPHLRPSRASPAASHRLLVVGGLRREHLPHRLIEGLTIETSILARCGGSGSSNLMRRSTGA